MKKYLLLAAAATIGLASCNNDDDSAINTKNLTLNLTGLEDLGQGYAYEGWVMVNGTPVTTGVFTVNSTGVLSQTVFPVDAATLDAGAAFILTIEPSPDNDPAPSAVKYLAGAFTNNTASISTNFGPAPGDFSAAAGSFFLRTPTDEVMGNANNGNDTNGVWFGLPGMPPVANATLPVLPEGWIYEGWVVGAAGPISTGTFASFSTRDSSNGFSGTIYNMGPPVPGEDFFRNLPAGESLPFSVVGKPVVISIEPVPDNSPAPFTLKPLAAMATAATAPMSQAFNNNVSATFPTGSVTKQ